MYLSYLFLSLVTGSVLSLVKWQISFFYFFIVYIRFPAYIIMIHIMAIEQSSHSNRLYGCIDIVSDNLQRVIVCTIDYPVCAVRCERLGSIYRSSWQLGMVIITIWINIACCNSTCDCGIWVCRQSKQVYG